MGNVSGSNGIQQFGINHHMQLQHATLLTETIQQKQQKEYEQPNYSMQCGIGEQKNSNETLLHGNQRQHYTYFSNHDYQSASTPFLSSSLSALTTIATAATTTSTVTTAATALTCVPNKTLQNRYLKHHQQQQQRHYRHQQKQNSTFHTRSLPLPHNDNCQNTHIMCMYSRVNLQQKQQQHEHLKVLPTTLNVHERPKLRSTKNGVILNAGGTISGRREQLLLLTTTTVTPTTTTTTLCSTLPQQQSHVRKLIDNEQFIYRRSSTMFDITTTAVTAENQSTTTVNKTQKYLKKRKAPAIPTSATVALTTTTIPTKTTTITTSTATTPTTETQKKLPTIKKLVQVESNTFSLNNNKLTKRYADDEIKTTIAIIDKPLPYRRERSSNAILLRQRLPDAVPEQQQLQQHKQQQRELQCAIPQNTTTTTVRKSMPTFYFDIQRNATATTTTANKKMTTTTVKEYRDENDLLICVRPVLPRRQLKMPNFSPSVAWRNINSLQQQSNIAQTLPMVMQNELPIKKHIPQEAEQQHQWQQRHIANMVDQKQDVANGNENNFNCFSSPKDINTNNFDKEQPQQNAHLNKTLVLRNKQFFGLYNFNSLQPLKHYLRQQCLLSDENINNDEDGHGDDDVVDADDVDGDSVNDITAAMDDNWVLHRVAAVVPESINTITTTTTTTTTTITSINATIKPTTTAVTNTEMYNMPSLSTPTKMTTSDLKTSSSNFGRNCKSIGYLIGSKHQIYLPTLNAVTYDSIILKGSKNHNSNKQ